MTPEYKADIIDEIGKLVLNFKSMKMSCLLIISYFVRYTVHNQEKGEFKQDLKNLSKEICENYKQIEKKIKEMRKGKKTPPSST